VKIAIIGGASVRTPLLVKGLSGSGLPVEEIALFDTDQRRLAAVAALARSYAPRVREFGDARSCVTGAAFVVLSIRPGGIAARARDESTAMAHGIVGQETVGPAGFAMAMRTVPPSVEYARVVAEAAPNAWIINFTNPVGMVTHAITAAGHSRAIGICDTPTELFERTAHVLDLPHDRCFFDYFGLNHLGWLREVYVDGRPQLHALWSSPECLAHVYGAPFFSAASLRDLRLLPTEYLFFYYSPAAAYENMRRAGHTRAAAITTLNEKLFHDLAADGAERLAVYEAYLDARSAGYMQTETGIRSAKASAERHDARSAKASLERHELAGYDRIALAVIRAIHFNANAIIPLNVLNRASISILADEDIVEVPCVVNGNGARPLATERPPASVRDLILRVREYERLTVHATSTRNDDDATRALAANPLIPSREVAASLVRALQPW
jgi:6-phospho-beta-glucosidase